MHTRRTIIEIDERLCNGCGRCVKVCAEGALEVVNGKARVVSDSFCDGLGACIGMCPQGALRIIERESVPFDKNAAAEYQREQTRIRDAARLSRQCPAATLRQLHAKSEEQGGQGIWLHDPEGSALMNWPVKLRLVPFDAMFLKSAYLLIVSDCVPFAYPALHREFMRNKAVLTGCPKFDDREAYVRKFADIFRKNDIAGMTVAVMEVPCCQAMPEIVLQGLAAADRHVPFETVVIGIEGAVLKRVKMAA